MVTRFYERFKARKRRRALATIRREFARGGYPLDQFRDAQIERALMLPTDDLATAAISAKSIYRTVKRLRRAAHEEAKVGR
ncbi:MAG TPA: hypothetical protein VIB00_01765 [Pyrinomonadaceae bacterium]